MPRSRLLLLAAALTIPLACQSAPRAPTARVLVPGASGPVALNVEVADTETLILHGLMDRQQLDPNAGMLFVFGHDRPHPFWMRRTLIPLDILFLGPDGTVRSIVERTPLDLTTTDGEVNSTYVLEVNAGWSRAHGIRPGSRLQLDTKS